MKHMINFQERDLDILKFSKELSIPVSSGAAAGSYALRDLMCRTPEEILNDIYLLTESSSSLPRA